MELTGDSVTVQEEIPKFYFHFVAVTNLHTNTHTRARAVEWGITRSAGIIPQKSYHEEDVDIFFFPRNSKINKRQNCKEKN